MIVIVGLVVLLVAVIVGFTGVLTNAGPAHPLPENFAVFGYHVTGSTGTLFLFGIVVRGGDAGTVRVAGRGAAHRGPRARRSTRTQKVPTRDGVSEPGARPTARTPAGRRGQWVCGAAAGADPPQQGSAARSLLARSTTDGHRACRRAPVGTDPGRCCPPAVGAVIIESEGVCNEYR